MEPLERHDETRFGPVASDAFAVVDRYLSTELEARALSLAFRWGWIDRMLAHPLALQDLASSLPMPLQSARIMRSLLAAADVVDAGDPAGLTENFRAALKYRDLLEAKLWFAEAVVPDIHRGFDKLLTDIRGFMAEANVFELFRYDRCFEVTPEDIALTRRWVSYTTTLTKYEAPACWERVELSGVRGLLDIGGNSGEFARQACARAPNLSATVYDLPVVCALGEEHVAGSVEADRISFHPGDLRRDKVPGGFDLISFKSVLHDWPEEDAVYFLGKAADALTPGGRLLIFERGPLPTDGRRLSYAIVPNLVFLPFFREARFYRERLEELGFGNIRHEEVALDIPFHLITAEKRG